MIPRIIDIPLKKKSIFLFGPRQVGKSRLVKHLLADMDFLEVNLLKGDILLKYKFVFLPAIIHTWRERYLDTYAPIATQVIGYNPYMAGEIPVIPWRALFNKDHLSIV